MTGIACAEETKRMESIDKAIHGMVTKSSGCNKGERTGDLENLKSGAELTVGSEGNTDRCRLD